MYCNAYIGKIKLKIKNEDSVLSREDLKSGVGGYSNALDWKDVYVGKHTFSA